MKKGRAVYCLFCDDIRQEVGGKFSLVGVYSSEMIIGAPHYPLLIPRLAVHIWVSTPIGRPIKSISGVVLGTSGEELGQIQPMDFPANQDRSDDVSRAVMGVMAVLPPIQVLKQGSFEVWMEVDGERERAGRLHVRLHQADRPPTPVPTV